MKSWVLIIFGVLLFSTGPGYAQHCAEERFAELAKNMISQGEFSLAKDSLEAGFECLRDSTIPLLLTYYEVLRNLRKTKLSFEVAMRTLKICEQQKCADYRFSVMLNVVESCIFRKKFEKSKAYLAQLNNLIEQQEKPVDRARLNYVQGLFLLGFDKSEEAGLRYFQKALQLLQQIPAQEIYLRGQLLRNLGNRSRVRGDFSASLRYYREELDIYHKHYVAEHPDLAITHYNIGSVLYEMNEYRQALDHYHACYAVWKKDFKTDSPYFRFLTEAMGDLYFELGEREDALHFYDIATAREPQIDRDSGRWLNHAADTLLQAGKLTQALSHYQRALDFRRRHFGNTHPLTVACQNYVGKALQAEGNEAEALKEFEQSIHILEKQKTLGLDTFDIPKNNVTNNSIPFLLEALAGKGSILLKQAEQTDDLDGLRAASKTLARAVHCLELFRRSPISEASKLYWNRRSIPLLENAIRTEVLLYQLTQKQAHLLSAFELSEKNKAFLLRSALQSDRLIRFTGIPAEIIQKERSLRQQLLHYENKIVGEERRCTQARQNQLSLWREKQTNLYRDYDLLIRDIQQSYPRYFTLRYQIPTVPVVELQRVLGTVETGLLEFFEGEKHVYVFYLDADRVQVFVLSNTAQLQSKVNQLSRLMSDRTHFLRAPKKAYQNYTMMAGSLYRDMLKPVLREDTSTVKSLLFVPGKQLSAISFAALLTEDVSHSGHSYRELPYLIDKYAIAYTASASMWYSSMQQNPPESGVLRYAGFAPDYSDAHYPGVAYTSPLPFSQEEVATAKTLLGGRSFTGTQATEKAFREQSAQLIHLAAHAWLDDVDPLLSKLLLLPGDSTEDGILHAYEFYEMQLPAQLSILSACRTAAGKFEPGEGMISLERAFQYAGCPAVMSSFWAIDDEATSRLTHLFLQSLQAGETKHRALQLAQQQLLRESDPASALPFYWAGFRLAGNVRAMEWRKKTERWRNILGIGVCLLFLIVGLWVSRRFY